MENKISHEGVVETVKGDCARVRIVQAAACAGCKIAAHCNASESKIKYIDVKGSEVIRHKPGDSVIVSTTVGMGSKAVRIAFVWPLLLLVVSLFGVKGAGGSDNLAVGIAFALLAVYFFILYLLRDKIGRRFSFSIDDTAGVN